MPLRRMSNRRISLSRIFGLWHCHVLSQGEKVKEIWRAQVWGSGSFAPVGLWRRSWLRVKIRVEVLVKARVIVIRIR